MLAFLHSFLKIFDQRRENRKNPEVRCQALYQRLHLFVSGTDRETTMEARQPSCNGETCTGHAQSHPGPPETTRSSRHAVQRHNRRRTRRIGHELELIIPAFTLEVVTTSSYNLPADVATIADPIRFKNVVKGHTVYNLLTNTKSLEDRN